MKAFLTFFILYFFSLSVSAQQFKRIFLFNDFVQAQIKFRNHSVSVVSLNYDASNKTMLFRQGEEMMEMTNPAQVDTVIIGKRKFVPVGRGFYEVVCRKEGVVYIDWLLKDVNIGSKGALGTVTQGSVKNLQMSDLGLNGTEMYTPKIRTIFYLILERKTNAEIASLLGITEEAVKAYRKRGMKMLRIRLSNFWILALLIF